MTLARGLKEVACIETWEKKPGPFLRPSILHSRVAVHHLKHDWQVLAALGIDLERCPSTRCTMLEAAALGLPQSLKVLGFRLFGYVMSEYEDLIEPLDTALVAQTLTVQQQRWQQAHTALQARALAIETKRAQGKRVTKKAVKARYVRLLTKAPDLPPMRVVNGIARMIAWGQKPTTTIDA